MRPDARPPATHSAPSIEWAMLLAACGVDSEQKKTARIRTLLQPTLRWQSLFDLAERHGVAPLLHQSLSAFETSIPPDNFRWLHDQYHRNLHKALFLSRELIRILQHLEALGVDAIPYKGLALAESMYGDIALRQSGDIDLFIQPQDLPRVTAAVAELGYTPHARFSRAEMRSYMKSGYELSFDGHAGPNLLEVQWGLQPRFYAVDYEMSGLFQRAETVRVAGHLTKTPSPEDLFLVLSMHAAKHVWGRLIWLRDIAQVMALPNLNWSWIEAQARELGVVRILGVTMQLAGTLLNAPTPAAAQGMVADTKVSILAGEIRDQILREEICGVESAAYFQLMLRLRERKSDRRRFLRRLVLTAGPGEWKAVRLPAPLFPLYRVVRVFRLAARLARG